MIQKIKKSLFALAALVALSVPALAPMSAAAATTDIKGGLCSGSDFEITTQGNNASCSNNTNTSNINDLLRKVVNVISAIVGVVAVVMIIVGGFKYITSGGDSSNVSGAKNTIIYAIIGLVIVALAQLIVRFVLNQTSSIT